MHGSDSLFEGRLAAKERFSMRGIPPPMLGSRLLARLGVGPGSHDEGIWAVSIRYKAAVRATCTCLPFSCKLPWGACSHLGVRGHLGAGNKVLRDFPRVQVPDPDHRGRFQTLTRMLFFCVCVFCLIDLKITGFL